MENRKEEQAGRVERAVKMVDVCVICELRPEHCTGHNRIIGWGNQRYAVQLKAVPANTIQRIRS